jgi:PAS domain S-box-containing protein
MKQHTTRKNLPPGRELLTLLLALAFVLSIAVASYTTWMGFRRTSKQLEITRRIVSATSTLLSNVKDAETGQRGFLLTSRDSYLEPYRQAILKIPQNLADLTNATATRPDQAQQAKAIQPLVEKKLAELQQTIELRRSQGSEAALNVVMGDEGKAVMDQIRKICSDIESVADRRFGQQVEETEKRGNEIGLIGVLGSLALFVLLVLATATIQRGTHRRIRLISELATSEESTRQARDWFQTTLSSIGDAVIATDAHSKITFLNGVAQSLTGWTQEEAVGLPLDQVFLISNEDTGAKVESPVTKALREGRIVGLANHTNLTAKDGRQTPIDDSASPIRDVNGTVAGVVLVFRNISERKGAEMDLRHAEQRFRTAVSAVSDVLWTNNGKGEMVGEQPGWAAFTGQSLEEYQGYGWAKAVHPDDAQPTIDEWNRAVAERKKFIFEHRVRRHDGAWRVCSVCALPESDGAGEIQEWVGVHNDITDRKQAEQAMQESEERFRTLANNVSQFAWMADEKGQAFWHNQRWFDYTGTTPEEMEGFGWKRVHHPDHLDRVSQHIFQCFETGEIWEDTFPLRGKDGTYRWFLSRALPIRDAEGKILRWFGTNTDISEQREIEDRLRRANEDLESFAYSASHDLQEPLRMITIYSQLLVSIFKGQVDDKADICVNYITDGTRRMTELLADLLAYTAVDSKTVDDAEVMDLNLVFQEVTRGMEVAIAESGATITSEHLPTVNGHRAHFVQLFQNLISNCIKYRSQRPCHIHVSAQQEGGNWSIAVTDNGMGIAPQYHERVFGVFKRLHGKKIPGTGIGLAICQRVVERYKGRIWVESELDKGATFLFTLPIGSESSKAADVS